MKWSSDARPSDTGGEQKVVDSAVSDSKVVVDQAVDQRSADLHASDVGNTDSREHDMPDTGALPDRAVADLRVLDLAGADQGAAAAATLLSGGFGSLSPVTSKGYVLLESRFSGGGTVCDPLSKICMSGGITQ